MSYQALARKWRPRTFAEMAGQEHVLRALINGLERGQLHHAFLFTGTRGVGKTTIARILAKCLNCEQGVTAEPCGQCSACQEIDQGRFVDLIEVDAASRTKVDDTRDLLDNVQYAPSRGRYKIYLIDEIHMFSNHSFNALLKTLEEPPPHVKFLLATTDPQKIPVTILSRCLQFSLKRLPASLIAERLEHVLKSEDIAYEAPALVRLGRAADGSMRDGLSLLDQAIAFGSGEVREVDTRSMLGDLEGDFAFELLEALAAGDGPAVLSVVERMSERAPDFAEALAEILSTLHYLALSQTIPQGLGEEVPDRERLQALAQRLSREDVQLFYQIGLHGRRDLPLAPDPRAGFEMVLLRMLAFRPAEGGAAPAPQVAPQAARPAAPAPAGSQRPPAGEPAPPPAPKSQSPAPSAPPAEAASAASDTDWPSLVRRLPRGMPQVLASHCEWVGRDGEVIHLRIDPGHDHLCSKPVEQKLEQALRGVLGEAVSLKLDRAAVQSTTPAAIAAESAAQRQQAANEAIQNDPNVAALREAFGAEVLSNTIEPTE